jgi:hypothetical protein
MHATHQHHQLFEGLAGPVSCGQMCLNQSRELLLSIQYRSPLTCQHSICKLECVAPRGLCSVRHWQRHPDPASIQPAPPVGACSEGEILPELLITMYRILP